MRLTIDCREPQELITILENFITNHPDNIPQIFFDKRALDIGDAIIYFDETDLSNPNKQIIFERKTLADLIASIKDGRYNEQSYRLDKSPTHNHNIYYIIEGNIERFCKNTRNLKNPLLKQTIYSTMFTLSYYKGFSLINSQDIQETATFIYRFLDKLLREKTRKAYYCIDIFPTLQKEASICNNIDSNIENIQNTQTHSYSDCIKTTKKSNITHDNILEIMLIQIPNVCPAAAQAVSTKFKTMKNLIDYLEKDPECLNEIVIRQNKIRSLSKIAKSNIFKYILQRDQIIEINIDHNKL
jgi:ERCC4-type nuclease